MAVRRLVAHHETQDAQNLKIDHATRYIENHSEEWQFLFGPNSELNNSDLILKHWAKFNETDLNSLQIAAYLYDKRNASISNAAGAEIRLYKINTTNTNWSETLIDTLTPTQLPNNYYFYNALLSTYPTIDFEGGDTIMLETTLIRLGITYRDRIYVNHLGIYDSMLRLRADVEFLDLTKLDE